MNKYCIFQDQTKVSFFGSQQLYPLHTKKKEEPNKEPTSPKLRINRQKSKNFYCWT